MSAESGACSIAANAATLSPGLNRRAVLGGMGAAALLVAADAGATCPSNPLSVCNVTHLYSVMAAQVIEVQGADDIRQALRRWPGKVSVGGGRFSMGGQTALGGGLQLDMRKMQRLVALDPRRKIARVQAGMRWRDLQALIDPHGLAVRTMQSYANFTVGGSVSVNCHGRYVGHGPIAASVRAMQLVLADGSVLEVSPSQNAELFFAAIGGYGAVGVVTEVELSLDDNFPIERQVEQVALDDYPDWFKQTVANDSRVLLHNADLQPPDFEHPIGVTWRRTDMPVTESARLRSTDALYLKEKAAVWAVTELPGGAALQRQLVTSSRHRHAVVWRNFESGLDVAELEPPTRALSTYVLQEYFVPERHFRSFVHQMKVLLKQSPATTLNVSVRHSPADRHTLMAWAREDVFSFVVYHKQRINPAAQSAVAQWTRAMVALALMHGGTYYLPYQLHATQGQFEAAYPQAGSLRTLRRSVGAIRFSNTLWDRYGV